MKTPPSQLLRALTGLPSLPAIPPGRAPRPEELAVSLADVVWLRFRKQLDFKEVAVITAQIARNLRLVEALREVKLRNGDSPVSLLRPGAQSGDGG